MLLVPLGVLVALVLYLRDRRKRVFWSLSFPVPEPDFYFEGPDLTAEELLLVIDALRRHPKVTAMKHQLTRKFETATRVNYAPIDWEKVQAAFDKEWAELEAQAAEIKASVSDLLFDRRDGAT